MESAPPTAAATGVNENRDMASREESRPKRRRRSLVWLLGLLLVLFGLYSAGWFWAAERVRSETDKAVAGLNAQGIQAECANLKVSGYPLRFNVTCDSMAYQDDSRAIAATAGGLSATASLFMPLWPTVDLDGPLRTIAPGMTPLWIDWDRLRATTSLSWPLPAHVTLSAEGLSGQTDPEDTDPIELFSAANAEAELSPDGRDLDYSGWFSDLEIDAEALGGRAVPALDAKADAKLKNGVALLGGGAKSLRGQSVEIGNLELSSGDARISLSGPVSVDANGLIDASLKIKIENPKAVGAILAGAIPEKKGQIEQGFGALAMLGGAPMPLNVVKGKASLGFIPLGKIGPVR
jgi:hypothetical protein